jgi:hypothetical protein
MSIRYLDPFESSSDEMYQMIDVTQPQFDNRFQFTLPRLATTKIVDSSELCESPVGLTRNSTFSSVSPLSGLGSGDYFSRSPYSDPLNCGQFSGDDGEYSPPEKKRWYRLMQVVADSSITQTKGNAKPSRKGNNSYGRSGKPRCQQCRTWRQKVSPNATHPC